MKVGRDTQSDEELMAAYVAGDLAAFDVLFRRYADVLFRMMRRRLGSDDDARDLVQQTMLHLHRARHDFRPDARLRPWLFTIAMNLLREHYRRQSHRRTQSLELAKEAVDPAALPEAARQHGERAAQVRAAVAALPEQQREVIELHWFAESPYEEIAQIVGASVAAVRVRAHRGYERLRRMFDDQG